MAQIVLWQRPRMELHEAAFRLAVNAKDSGEFFSDGPGNILRR
jgi:hypothetical protein